MLSLLLLACSGSAEDSAEPAPVATVHLAFDDHGGTWETAEGWTVTLDQGWVVTTGASLGACPTEDLGKDHGTSVDERLRAPHVEALHTRSDQVLGTLVMGVGALCDAAWQVGRASSTDQVVGAPVEVDLIGEGLSLYLAGSARVAGTDPVLFAGGSSLEGEQGLPLDDRVGQVDLDLRIVRDLGPLFDGLDFSALTSGQVADAALINLAEGARFEVQ